MHTYRAHRDVTVLNDHMEVPGLGFLPVNAFVIHAAEPVVVDTGLGLPDRDFVASLSEVMDPADIRWIWITHPDRDHTGGVFALLEAAPRARVVTTFTGAGIMSLERPLPFDRIYLLNPGQSLELGDRQLTGFRPPLFDNPATVGVFDTSTGVALSSDCFGRRHCRRGGRSACGAAALGHRRQPLGPSGGPGPVRGLVPAVARLRPDPHPQHAPAAHNRRPGADVRHLARGAAS
jgi:flavorubredoxin